jgi:hypothetical protein
LLPQWQFLKDWFFIWEGEKLKNYLLTLSNRSFRKQLLGTAFSRPGRIGWLKNLKAKLHYFQSK